MVSSIQQVIGWKLMLMFPLVRNILQDKLLMNNLIILLYLNNSLQVIDNNLLKHRVLCWLNMFLLDNLLETLFQLLSIFLLVISLLCYLQNHPE